MTYKHNITSIQDVNRSFHENETDTLLNTIQVLGLDGSKPIIPVSRMMWWRMYKNGTAPKPIMFGTKKLWRLSDLRAFVAKGGV